MQSALSRVIGVARSSPCRIMPSQPQTLSRFYSTTLLTRGQSRVAIIGVGQVGATIAYSIMLRNVASEIMLVDANPKILKGQVLDLGDANWASSTKVRGATFQEAGQADVIVITAGAKQREGESRFELIDRNYEVLKQVIGDMQPIQPNAILIMVSNPVDVLTYIAQRLSGLPRGRVFGTGTFLDSSRLRGLLSEILNVSTASVNADVLGEHGDSQFIAWQAATFAGRQLLGFPEIQRLDKQKIHNSIAGKAMDIIQSKGSTYYGIGTCTASICESILLNTSDVRPLSVYVERLNIVLSMPARLNANGVDRVYSVALHPDEEEKLMYSASTLRNMCQRYD